MQVFVVYCTFPSEEKARQIATVLIESQLAACVNLLPPVQSIYSWEGKIEQSQEVLAIIKTNEQAYAALEAKILELHPYEVPEIIALPVQRGAAAYLRWVHSSLAG